MKRAPSPGGAPATLARRALALVYEAPVLIAVLLVGTLPFLLIAGTSDPLLVRPLLQVYLLALCGGYFVWHWLHGGQTLPMKTWRVQLVTRGGAPLTWRHAVCRFVLALIGLATFGAGFLWAIIDPDRQFLHDRLTGTRIVNSL